MTKVKDSTSDHIMKDASAEDISQVTDTVPITRKSSKTLKGHEIYTRTIRNSAWSYACLELITDPPSKLLLDELMVRTYLTSAFTQLFGLTGSAISVDILKVKETECWLRVPGEDLSAVIAAVGDWTGGNENDGMVAWKVNGSGDWLGHLVGKKGVGKIWTG